MKVGFSVLSVRGTRMLREVSCLPDPTPRFLRPSEDIAACDTHCPTIATRFHYGQPGQQQRRTLANGGIVSENIRERYATTTSHEGKWVTSSVQYCTVNKSPCGQASMTGHKGK